MSEWDLEWGGGRGGREGGERRKGVAYLADANNKRKYAKNASVTRRNACMSGLLRSHALTRTCLLRRLVSTPQLCTLPQVF